MEVGHFGVFVVVVVVVISMRKGRFGVFLFVKEGGKIFLFRPTASLRHD